MGQCFIQLGLGFVAGLLLFEDIGLSLDFLFPFPVQAVGEGKRENESLEPGADLHGVLGKEILWQQAQGPPRRCRDPYRKRCPGDREEHPGPDTGSPGHRAGHQEQREECERGNGRHPDTGVVIQQRRRQEKQHLKQEHRLQGPVQPGAVRAHLEELHAEQYREHRQEWHRQQKHMRVKKRCARVDVLKCIAAHSGEEQEVAGNGQGVVQVQLFSQGQEHGQVDQDDHCQTAVIEKVQLLLVGSGLVKIILLPDLQRHHHRALGGDPDIKRFRGVRGYMESI